jgi:ABC-type nickel/cobalt efflux system permease component RcnA
MLASRFRVWCIAVAILFYAASGCAYAHPLGNFTINHLAKISTGNGKLHVRYVLDIAEIPTFQIMHATSATGSWTDAQRDSWALSELSVVTSGLDIEVDGTRTTLTDDDVHARLRPGAGGLPILYWVADFDAPLNPGAHRISVTDSVYSDRRIGWKDIVIAPASEPTGELLHYPTAMIGSPRHVSAVTYDVSNSDTASHVVATSDAVADVGATNSLVRNNALTDMFSSSNRAPLFIFLTALVAFGLGALHAIEPGHGKALLAFTLVGSRATVKQAAILAASLTFAHTIGVLILGAVLFFAAGFVSESIYSWITLASGAAVAIIGARNLARYLRARNVHAHGDGHVHAPGHTHDHHHGDGPGGHSHAIPGSGPIDFRGAVVAAMSGGVAPCPAAIVVMLAALRLHQLGYGLILIVIFSMGLASVLTALGIAVVHGSAWVSRSGKFERIVNAGPFISAALISVVGAIMLGQGFVQQGVHTPVWLIAGIALLAIGGYALSPKHHHSHTVEHA